MVRGRNRWECPELTLFDDSIEVSKKEKKIIPKLLRAASHAITNPSQSGFNVMTAAINNHGKIVVGGNREYGFSRAYVHGEEAVSSSMCSQYPGTAMEGIGFWGENMSIIPCGNCRDVLVEEWPENLLFVAGNEKKAKVARLSTFLHESSPSEEALHIAHDMSPELLDLAVNAARRGVKGYLPRKRQDEVYSICIVDEAGEVFPGSLDTTVAYDATSPGVAARQVYRNRVAGASTEVNPITRIIATRLSANGELPHVLYRDRNALADLDEVSKATQEQQPAQVLLVGVDYTGSIQNAATTDAKEWLPHPFTNWELGDTEALRREFGDLVENT